MALSHATTYRYDRPMSLGPQLIRLRPAAHTRTIVEDYRLAIEPAAHALSWQQDAFANWVARATFPDRADTLAVRVDIVADLQPINPFDFFIELYAIERPFDYPADLRGDLAPFLTLEPQGVRFDALVARFADAHAGTIQFLIDLNTAVRAEVGYTERLEPGTQTPEATLCRASGSCRDSGWLLVQLMRHLGLAARFVSGYSIQLADGAEVTADVADLHAWAEAFIPGAGWIGLDPTSGLMTGEGHIPLAATPHYRSATPIEGAIYGEGNATFDFALTVRRL